MKNDLYIRDETLRTFAHKKGAVSAIKRDLVKHHDAHGDVLFDTGFEAKESDEGRWGVVLFVDLTPAAAKKLVGPELNGYVIKAELAEEPKIEKPTPKPVEAKTEPAQKRQRVIDIAPRKGALIPARFGSMQQKIIDMLAREEGATLDELTNACVRKDGTNWKSQSLQAGLYCHIPYKGYGMRQTVRVDGVIAFHIVLPEGIDKPAAPRRPAAQHNLIERIRSWAAEENQVTIAAMGDDEILSTFKNLTQAKKSVEA